MDLTMKIEPDRYTVITAPHDGWVRQRIFLNGECVSIKDMNWKEALHKGQTLIDQATVALRQAEGKKPPDNSEG